VKGRYGSPRVYQELRALGIPCGEHRVARLMRRAGLKAKSPLRYRITTRTNPTQPAAANMLDRQFAVAPAVPATAPDRVWAADITYIPTREGWLYLAVLLDVATRRVVGWARSVPTRETLSQIAPRRSRSSAC
jgi:putative transposase